MKKVHWLQTPEGKARMSRSQKKAWRKRKATSKADRVVEKAVAKKAGTTSAKVSRAAQYERIAKMAVANGEVPQLTQLIGNALFLSMWMHA